MDASNGVHERVRGSAVATTRSMSSLGKEIDDVVLVTLTKSPTLRRPQTAATLKDEMT